MKDIIVKSFDYFPFVADKHNNIWKHTKEGHFLKITPWESGEDRRVNVFQIESLIKSGKLTQYSAKSKIFEMLNKRWDEITWSWEYNGDRFDVDLQSKNGNDFYKAPVHNFRHTYKDQTGKEHEWFSSYRIVFYNGNIYWATPYHYWPQVQLYKFVSVDQEPNSSLDGWFRWVKGNHLRPVYSVNRGEYI